MIPDNDSITYRLLGTDMGSFAVSNTGQITVDAGTVLDYETKDTYSVVVRATDTSSATASATVTISVTNVDETGMIILSSTQPEVGVGLTAVLSDPDGGVSGATWSWAKSSDQSMWDDISAATSITYTPVAGDVGNHLRVTAMYKDTEGSGKSAPNRIRQWSSG